MRAPLEWQGGKIKTQLYLISTQPLRSHLVFGGDPACITIYADAYRLALHVEQQVLGFAAKHRPAIGFTCRNAATCDSPATPWVKAFRELPKP